MARSCPLRVPPGRLDNLAGVALQASLLARGPWTPERVESVWREERYEPPADVDRAADDAVAELRERGSPAHDGVAARLADWRADGDVLRLELQPARWALRLVDAEDANSLTAICVVRSEDGRWLAGRRAGWVASWAGRSAPAAPWRSARTRPARWPASSRRSGSSCRPG